MILNFKRRAGDSIQDKLNISKIMSEGELSNEDIIQLEKIKEAWDFYEGYHWEGIDDLGHPQVTFNYCRPFVNKFVAFELGKGFTIKTPTEIEEVPITVNDPTIETDKDTDKDGVLSETEQSADFTIREKTQGEFLADVWNDNKKDVLITQIGQTKSITGEAWVKVQYVSSEDMKDPFEKYPNGRIRITCVPTQYVFPEFNEHDADLLESLLIMYPIKAERDTGILFKRKMESTVMYKEVWTSEEIVVYHDSNEVDRMENPYGFIPFVQIKNFPVAGHTRGQGDLEDIIPLNVELNTKKSDVSEVIDYHSAPITLVYGAKIGNLEKGANKVWGGLPKDAKVENLGLQGDLTAATAYMASTKTAMCEIGGIPETTLGGASAISNTSGVALQYINMPIIDRTNVKRSCTCDGLQTVNEYVLFIAQAEGLIEKPAKISMRDFVKNTVELPDTLPKDKLMELNQIQQELTLGLECRHGAMERLGKTDIHKKIAEIDIEREQHPELFNPLLQSTWYQNLNNGGMMNGDNPVEQVRKELTGQNGGTPAQPKQEQ